MLKKRLSTHLSGVVPQGDLDYIYNSFDIIGDIAIVRLTERSRKHGKIIADKIMEIHKNVRTILAQINPVTGDFRLRKLEFVSGEDDSRTVHKEFGCLFSVDVRECYFSPRLLHERMRIAEKVKINEVILNMFAGIGCFSIIIGKYSQARRTYSVDINPVAIHFMQENIMLNNVFGKVIPIQGDAKEIIKKELYGVADRVLMPLPQKAQEYIPYALSALKTGGGWIHDYLFEHADKNEDPIQKAKRRAGGQLRKLDVSFEFDFARVVRATGPRWYQIVLDIHIISPNRE